MDYEICLPKFRQMKLQRSIKYRGINIWNDVSCDTRKNNFHAFKSKLKQTMLLHEQYHLRSYANCIRINRTDLITAYYYSSVQYFSR